MAESDGDFEIKGETSVGFSAYIPGKPKYFNVSLEIHKPKDSKNYESK